MEITKTMENMQSQTSSSYLSSVHSSPVQKISQLTSRCLLATSILTGLGLIQVACANPPNYGYQDGYQSGYAADSSINYFNDAARAAERGDIGSLYQYEQMMNGGLFAMYPAYWRLNKDLATQNSAAIAQFVRQYHDSVMAEKLVADYVEAKAKVGDYAAIQQVANLVTNPDSSEKCALALGFNRGGDVVRTMVAKPDVWLTTTRQPELCKQLASELTYNSMITNKDRHERIKRMLRIGDNDDIVLLANALGTPISHATLSEVRRNPRAFISRLHSQPYSQTNQYLYLYAIGRLADSSYHSANAQLSADISMDNQRYQHLLSDETRRYAYRILGVKRMNHNTDDGFSIEAVEWFRNSLGEPFNFEEAEDYAQAAIRFSQWQDVMTAIGAMDGVTQQEPIWQYWLARSYEQSADSSQKAMARQIYQRLALKDDYYGFLAKDRVGQRYDAARQGGHALPNISDYDRQRLAQDPHFSRAFALYRSSANPSFARREWNWAVKKARDNRDNGLIIAAAKQAYDMGWLDRAIYAIDNTDNVHSLALSHPMPYQSSVIRYSRNVGIDPAWAYGIMRQESRFVNSARSNVGASGLMQIMPGTGKYIARKLGESYSASRVNSGDTNIRYGTWYMSDVLAKLNYQPVLATAGYNAGPARAKRWQPDYSQLPADQYIESIAFPETRNYVKRVMENATIYSSLLGNNIPISQRMGVIPTAN